MKFQVKLILILLGLALLALAVRAAAAKPAAGDQAAFQRFLKTYEARVIPLSRDAALASFQASISGKDEDYQKSSALQIQLNKASSDAREFARLKSFRKNGRIGEPLLKRQLDIIYDSYLENQIPAAQMEEMVKLQAKIEQKFNTFRIQMDGKALSDNDAEAILRTSTRFRPVGKSMEIEQGGRPPGRPRYPEAGAPAQRRRPPPGLCQFPADAAAAGRAGPGRDRSPFR